MSMVEWVFDNRRVSLTIVVLLSLVGVQGYINLPKQENPDFTIRNATIITQLPGANAQRMEELVSSVLEQKIVEMPELDNVSSTSRNGMSIVVANYKESYTNMRPIFDDLRRKVDDAAQDLPAGVIGPVVDDEFDVFGSVYTLSGEGYSFPELKDKAEDIRDLLLGIDEVAKVEFQGIRDETIYVEYSDAKLRELGFTANELANAIRDTNIISSGGRMLVGNERISLEPTGDFSGIEALRTTVLRNAAGDLFQIQDLAQGSRVLADPPSELVFASGEAAVSINISMREGGDILVLGERLDELFADVEARLPIGMEIRKTAFQADFVELTVNNFVSSILQAVLIVGIVLLLFLGPRTGVIIAASIPVTIAITLAAMNWLGMAIDQVSLSGLIIALGLLVDNSIVIAESIQLRLQRGEGRLAAAAAVAGEMRIPLMIGSATTIAAFLPIALAESAVGEFCASIFYIVAIALTVSWGLSMTVVPLLGGLMLPAGQASGGEEGTWMRSYRALVSGAVKMRFVTILVAAALFYSMTIAMGMVANVFIPPSDEPLFTVELDMPQGVDISVPERIALDMNEWFASDEAVSAGITNWTQYVGISAPAFKLGYSPGQSDAAHMTALVNVSDGSALDGAIAATAATIAANYPDAQYKVDRLSQGPPVSYPVQIRLSGPEVAGLEKLSAELASELRGIEGVLEIINDWGVRSRKILVDIDPDRANSAGVSNSDVASSLATGISGETVSELREGEDRIPVVLRTMGSDRTDFRRLPDLTVNSATGGSVALGQVADVQLDWEVPLIKRRDRVRTLTLSVTTLPGYSATDINRVLRPWLQAWDMPFGYSYEEGGESETSGDATQSIVDKLPIAGLIIVMLLLGQFNSFRKMGIVLCTIPLGLIGMAWGLVITDVPFGFFTILGIISLAGIVINNAIILLDRTKQEEQKGLSRREAVVEAACARFRPILLTTATTCGGMIPLWLGGGMFETMAVTLIFGMLVGTCITLLLVPALYITCFPREPEGVVAEPA